MIWFCTGNTCILYPINTNNEKSITNFKQKMFPLLSNTTLVMNWREVVCHALDTGEEYWICIRSYLRYRWLNYCLTPSSHLLRYVSLHMRTVIYQIRMNDARLFWFLSSQIFCALNLTIWELLISQNGQKLKIEKTHLQIFYESLRDQPFICYGIKIQVSSWSEKCVVCHNQIYSNSIHHCISMTWTCTFWPVDYNEGGFSLNTYRVWEQRGDSLQKITKTRKLIE